MVPFSQPPATHANNRAGYRINGAIFIGARLTGDGHDSARTRSRYSGVAWSQTTLLPNLVAGTDTQRPWSARLLQWAVEARSHRVICLVLGTWMLNGFDLVFTILSHEQGLLHEANPLARQLLSYGTPSIILFKVGLVLIGSYPLLRYRTARVTEMAAFLILAAYVVLAIRWSICYELYAATPPDGINLADIKALNAPPTH